MNWARDRKIIKLTMEKLENSNRLMVVRRDRSKDLERDAAYTGREAC